jgi:Flp pilus assembly protein TadB
MAHPKACKRDHGTGSAPHFTMLNKWKDGLHELANARPGERFMQLFERQQERKTAWLTWLYMLCALACAAIGVVLVFIPGPAFVFFILAGGLLASQSRWMARRLDRGELAIRALWRRVRGSSRPARDGNR